MGGGSTAAASSANRVKVDQSEPVSEPVITRVLTDYQRDVRRAFQRMLRARCRERVQAHLAGVKSGANWDLV